MSFTEHRHDNGVVWLTADNIASRHAFTTRVGGVSRGIFAGMNLSATKGDDHDSVAENLRRLGEATGLDTSEMVFTRQVHGTEVRLCTRADRHCIFERTPYEADGLVTSERDAPLVVMTADCVPVLLEDAEAGVVCAVHCGWRGTVADILGVAVGRMLALGAEAGRIQVAVGAAIGACCFETGPEVPEAAKGLLGPGYEYLWPPEEGVPGKYMVDLRGVCRERLRQLGIPYININISDECTMCSHDKYWSHRYTKGKRGTQAAIITL